MPEYFKDKENFILIPNLLDNKAKEEAEKLKNINKNKLRQFYHEIKNLEKSLEHQDWEFVKPFVKMVKAKIYYAYGRDSKLESLRNFLESNINQINDEKDFRAFCKFFEAVLGFIYGLKEENNNRRGRR